MKRRSHVTLDDIAKRLKVSRVTVSKALRGHPDISDETTSKVRKIANELGYTPNIMARNLSSRRSHMIGLVVPKIAHYFFGSLIEGVYNAAFENRYETILTVSQENAERERKHLQTLLAMRVDGIIISITQQTKDPEIFHIIRKSGIPLLFVDRRLEPPLPGFSSVLVDDREGVFHAVDHAIKIGYRKLGFVGGDPTINIGRNRLTGFEHALNQHNLPMNKEWIIHGGYGAGDGYNGFKILLNKGPLPEFIFAATYPVALGIYKAAKELGVRIPDDFDLICFGDTDVGEFISPALSVVRQPACDLGARAVQIMLECLAQPDVSREHHVILPTQLVLRETCIERRAQVIPSGEKVVKLKPA
ncbi:MAG: LacI family DNA-binding transcriptional regulator [Bacteroidetes bacterium]|nr:LacI family DNA-binding transcriptional regulator [Bacteroidota bacterium]MCW5894112.1 LacI family DNA-binding transcriptional regulator [Bacteroidota bacterium]